MLVRLGEEAAMKVWWALLAVLVLAALPGTAAAQGQPGTLRRVPSDPARGGLTTFHGNGWTLNVPADWEQVFGPETVGGVAGDCAFVVEVGHEPANGATLQEAATTSAAGAPEGLTWTPTTVLGGPAVLLEVPLQVESDLEIAAGGRKYVWLRGDEAWSATVTALCKTAETPSYAAGLANFTNRIWPTFQIVGG
jgi:hypothetical protein